MNNQEQEEFDSRPQNVKELIENWQANIEQEVITESSALNLALCSAAEMGKIDWVLELLQLGADPNIEVEYGRRYTALTEALPNMEMFMLLVNRGANYNYPGVIMGACYNAHEELISFLLEHDVSPNLMLDYALHNDLESWPGDDDPDDREFYDERVLAAASPILNFCKANNVEIDPAVLLKSRTLSMREFGGLLLRKRYAESMLSTVSLKNGSVKKTGSEGRRVSL